VTGLCLRTSAFVYQYHSANGLKKFT
jgi:hypothetical protein